MAVPPHQLNQAAGNSNWIDRETLYTTHVELFKHYSSLIFTARVSTITVTIVAILISFNALGSGLASAGESTTQGVNAIGYLTTGAMALILALWFMEIGYLWKFYTLIIAQRKLRGKSKPLDFFQSYRGLLHVGIPVYYTLALGVLFFQASKYEPMSEHVVALGVVVLAVVLGAWGYYVKNTYWRIRKYKRPAD